MRRVCLLLIVFVLINIISNTESRRGSSGRDRRQQRGNELTTGVENVLETRRSRRRDRLPPQANIVPVENDENFGLEQVIDDIQEKFETLEAIEIYQPEQELPTVEGQNELQNENAVLENKMDSDLELNDLQEQDETAENVDAKQSRREARQAKRRKRRQNKKERKAAQRENKRNRRQRRREDRKRRRQERRANRNKC